MRSTGLFVGVFDVTVLCLIWLTEHTVDSQLSAPDKLTAPYGGSVAIPCRYEQQYREHTKYWCKGSVYELCSIVVKTPKNRSNDRIFIADDKEAGVFTVTMTSLRDIDTDVYWCVIATSGRNVKKRVKLTVSHTVVTTTVTTPTSSSLEDNETRCETVERLEEMEEERPEKVEEKRQEEVEKEQLHEIERESLQEIEEEKLQMEERLEMHSYIT